MQHICEGYLLCVRCCAGDLSFLLVSPPLHFLDLFIAQRITELLLCQGTLDKRGAEVLVRQLRSTYSEDAAPHPRRTLEVTVESGVIPTGRGPHLRTQTESRVRTTTV